MPLALYYWDLHSGKEVSSKHLLHFVGNKSTNQNVTPNFDVFIYRAKHNVWTAPQGSLRIANAYSSWNNDSERWISLSCQTIPHKTAREQRMTTSSSITIKCRPFDLRCYHFYWFIIRRTIWAIVIMISISRADVIQCWTFAPKETDSIWDSKCISHSISITLSSGRTRHIIVKTHGSFKCKECLI